MNRLSIALATAALLACIAAVLIVTSPGCNPTPGVDLAREHAARAGRAEAVADRERDARIVLELERDAARDSLLIFSERTKQAAENERRATRKADDLLAELRGIVPSAPDSVRLTACMSALDACTIARRESAALASAQRVEIRALSDQVSRLSRIDSLRAGETLSLRGALGEMRGAYEGMEAAYESERAARLLAKRRLWIERGVWIGVVTFAVTR